MYIVSKNIVSKDKVYRIKMPEELYKGENLEGYRVKVSIYVIDEEKANLYNLTNAIMECFKKYDTDADCAPILDIDVFSNEKTYKFCIDWQIHFVNYMLKLARQIKF